MTKPNDPIIPTQIQNDKNPQCWDTINGLTIRQHMAIEFTKAMVTHTGTMNEFDIPSVVERGIKIADELIKQLNEK